MKCCFCDFTGTERAIKAHIAAIRRKGTGSHQKPTELFPPNWGVNAFGRPKGSPCYLCGWEHISIKKPDSLQRRKRFGSRSIATENGKLGSMILQGAMPVGSKENKEYFIGSAHLPENANQLLGLLFRLIPPDKGEWRIRPDAQVSIRMDIEPPKPKKVA